jgi:hypothetical protein
VSPLRDTPASGAMSRMAPPIIMAPLSANGIEDGMEDQSDAGQTLGRSQSVKGVERLSREVRGLDWDTSSLSGCLSPGRRCIATDA